MLARLWERVSRVDASSAAGFFIAVVILMSLVTLVSLVTGGIAIAVPGWVIFLGVALLRARVLERVARQGEAGTPDVPRKVGFARLAAGVYRDNLAMHFEAR